MSKNQMCPGPLRGDDDDDFNYATPSTNAAGFKYYLPYKITFIGGLDSHPLVPKAVGMQNPPTLAK